jgi:hypothetical protein
MLGYLYTLKYGVSPPSKNAAGYLNNKILDDETINKNRWNIERSFANYPIRMCIVRDPVQRFVSAYATHLNNIVLNEISIDQVIKNISRPEFIEENTRFINQTKPQVHFYGKDPSIYTHIFNINQMYEVKRLLETEADIVIPELHLHKSDPKKIADKLNENQISWIKNRYQEDYHIYGKFM